MSNSSSSRMPLVLLLIAATFFACNRDPNYAKQRALESGNKYFDRKQYKEALIMYRKAVATDPKFGEAYYRLALTFEALGENANVVGMLRRAAELMPAGTPDWRNAALRLGEALVQGAITINNPTQNKPLVDEVTQLGATLHAKAPDSFEDFRLRSDLKRAEAARDLNMQDMPALKKDLEDSIDLLRKSLSVKPGDVQTSIALARSLSLYGHADEAEQIYHRLLDHDKTLGSAYVELFRLYSGEKRNADAENTLKTAIQNLPKEYQFRTLLAGYYYSQGNRAEMTKVLEGIKSRFKDFPDAYLTAGDFYARINDDASALREYQQGQSLDPKRHSEYDKRMVEILIRGGKKEEAYNKVLEMLKSNPKDPDARAMQANFMLDRGEVSSAVTEFQDVVTQKPDNFVARYNLGRAYSATGDYQKAIQQYRESAHERPDFLRPRVALAETEIQTGDFDGALRDAQETVKMAPNDPAANLVEAIAMMRLGQTADAKRILDALATRFPGFPEVHLELGSWSLNQKDYAAALQQFQKSWDLNPADARALEGEVETYMAQKQPDKALALLQQVVASHPDRADILKQFATLKARTGQYDSALADFQNLMQHFKETPRETAQTYAEIGELYHKKGDDSNAIQWLEKARALQPNSVPLLGVIAEIYDSTGHVKESQDAYRAVLAREPNNGPALNNLAFSIAQTGTDLDEALTLADKAKKVMPTSTQVDDTLGWIYLKKHMPGQAVDIFGPLVAKSPDNPSFHYHYCLALFDKGDKAGAERECDAALARKPVKADEAGARQLLARLH
jgi:tetratricopeptide (TPR) repeat protein